MFGSNNPEKATKEAAIKCHWDIVNSFHAKATDSKKLDDAICEGVTEKVTELTSGKVRFDNLQDYLLCTLTLAPDVVKPRLIQCLHNNEYLEELEKECGMISLVVSISNEIHQLMVTQQYSYADALDKVNRSSETRPKT